MHSGKGMFSTIEDCRRIKKPGCISDICDGSLYQELVSSGFLAVRSNISLQFNTDGVPVFRSSSFSFWPLHMIINELPPTMRC